MSSASPSLRSTGAFRPSASVRCCRGVLRAAKSAGGVAVKGRAHKSEQRIIVDPRSQRRVRQVTDHPSIHHHPFFFVPAYDRAGNRLVFISHRTGSAADFLRRSRRSANWCRSTDRPDIAEWSIYPSPDGRYVYFTAGTGAWRVDLDDFTETQLADFGAVEMREKGMVGAAMGTTALSRQRPLVGHPRQGRQGQPLRRSIDNEAGDQPRHSRARHHRPSAVLSRRRQSDSLCRAARPTASGSSTATAAATAASMNARTGCNG